jgi:hypothetical protein
MECVVKGIYAPAMGNQGRLVTVSDFAAVEDVVEVRDCDPEPGHVTLVVKRGRESAVQKRIADRIPLPLQIHLLSAI